ncbi:hypothetical protein KORDIASMS9_02839 [Kordia sp. SMS9]|uniref:hypothetical protein n=1 Tax=Kordia sp. SMS9 TaxID=2282170 RepID=UPI000E0D9FE4|nr:hypothetical protein [Kordia sp. SMS9]AXG70599.1 hypothetical protein KORDIASMS9_02839 [Kordia sp. SMS9]
MKKQLPKPENWQDFESLCKKLWGEIWKIPNKIKKNGRAGQIQNGVDVYGIPKNEKNYWGIQCKGKDSYTHAKLTKSEIDIEIEKARSFKPNLTVLIFATTSNKDSIIEEYVRLKDFENRENQSFEILLFCWEDIVDLIEEHKDVHDYYMNSQKFKTQFDFELLFDENQDTVIEVNPEFYNSKIVTVIKPPSIHNPRRGNIHILDLTGDWSTHRSGKNLSYCTMNLLLTNTGQEVLEDWKLTFKVEGKYKFLGNYDASEDQLSRSSIAKISNPSAFLEYNDEFTLESSKAIIQSDHRKYPLWIRPMPEKYQIKLSWVFLARGYKNNGELIINVNPIIEDQTLTNEVDHYYELKEDQDRIDEKVVYQ